MMADQRNDLPPVNSPNFLEKVREALSTYLGNRGNKLDRGLTVRDLADAGIIKISDAYKSGPGGSVNPVGGVGSAVGGSGVGTSYMADLMPPPTPTGFSASAGFENILITVDVQAYTQGHGHGVTRLYGSTIPGATFDSVQTKPLMDFQGTVASYPATMGTTYHLWAINVSKDNVESVAPAPANDVYGLEVTTAPNIPAMLEALNKKIGASELNQTLNTRIDLIDSSALENSITSLLTKARTKIDTVQLGLTSEQTIRNDANESLASQVVILKSAFGDNQSGILSEQSARADAVSATASQLNALVAKTGASDAAIVSERVARTMDNEAMASQISGLTASIGDTNASITTLEQTKIGYATKGTVAFDNGGLITDQAWVDDWNAAHPTDKAVWHIGLPLAQAVKQVSITTGGYAIYHDAKKPTTGTAPDGFVNSAAVDTWNSNNPNDKALWIVGVTAAIEDKALALELENGKLSLSKTIKIDDNGRVSGYGIASENSHSQFITNVDTFAVTIPESSILVVALDTTNYAVGDLIKLVAPTPPATSAKIWMCLKAGKVTAAAKSALTAAEAAQPIGYAYKNTDALIADWQLTTRVPFSVAALAGSVDGVPIPTGAYMDGAYIHNLNADHITYGTIDGDIVHVTKALTAADITAGSIMTGDIKSTAVVAGTTVPKWEIKGDGTLNAQEANITGTIKAAVGSIGGITIAHNSIYSSGVTWNQGAETEYFTGTGFGVMPDGRFLIGNATGNRLTWDGVNLNVVGGGTFSGSLFAATGTFSGTLAAGVATFESIVSKAATEFTAATQMVSDAVWEHYHFTMEHNGIVTVILTFAFNASNTAGAWLLRGSVTPAENTLVFAETGGGYGNGITMVVSGYCYTGDDVVNIYCDHQYFVSDTVVTITILRSYR